MDKMPCVELCPDCPLRTMFPEGTLPAETPLHLKKVDERTLSQVDSYISPQGDFASLSIEHGTGPRHADIAILPEGKDVGPAIWVEEGIWQSGGVQQAFEGCHEPAIERYGFLRLSKRAVCEALRTLNVE